MKYVRVEPGHGELARYEVHHEGRMVGYVMKVRVTRERSTRGRTYVNARWTGKTLEWGFEPPEGGRNTHRYTQTTRSRAAEELIRS